MARLAAAMQTERADTRVNVERRQGMTEREREQELAALLAADDEARADAAALAADDGGAGAGADDDEDPDAKIYNPLKLPLGLGRQADPVLAVQAARARGRAAVRGVRQLRVHGEARVRQAFQRAAACAWAEVPGDHGEHGAVPGHHGDQCTTLKLWDKMTRDKKKGGSRASRGWYRWRMGREMSCRRRCIMT